MMKKYAGKVLAGAMAVSIMVPMVGMNVLAEDTREDTSTVSGTSASDTTCQTTVKYSVGEGYTWQVPTEVTFTANALTQTSAADNGVKITKNVIKSGQKLSIKLTADQKFTISANAKDQADATLGYEIYKGTTETEPKLSAGDEVLSAKAGINEASTAMTYKLTTVTESGKSEVAGSYTGTLSYTASVVAQ